MRRTRFLSSTGLRFETLEPRLTMSAKSPTNVNVVPSPAPTFTLPPVPDAVVIVPPQKGFAPILLPPGTITPTVTSASSPVQTAIVANALPAGLDPFVGAAESLAVTAAVNFQAAHPNAVFNVLNSVLKNSFTVTVSATDGLAHFSYTVTEIANAIGVGYFSLDGTHSELIVLAQDTIKSIGALAHVQFDGTLITQLQVVTNLKGVTGVYDLTPAAPTPVIASASVSTTPTSKCKQSSPPTNPTTSSTTLEKTLQKKFGSVVWSLLNKFKSALGKVIFAEFGVKI